MDNISAKCTGIVFNFVLNSHKGLGHYSFHQIYLFCSTLLTEALLGVPVPRPMALHQMRSITKSIMARKFLCPSELRYISKTLIC